MSDNVVVVEVSLTVDCILPEMLAPNYKIT